MRQDLFPVRQPVIGPGPTRQRRYVDLVDQVSNKRGLGQDLDFQERRRRLHRNSRQLLQPVQPARRVDVGERKCKDEATRPRGDPPDPACPSTGRPTANHMITVVDRLQERCQMVLVNGLHRSRDQDERQTCPLQAGFQGQAQVVIMRYDPALHRPAQFPDELDQGRDDCERDLRRRVGKLNDPDSRVGKRLALKVRLERIFAGLARGHSCPRRIG